MKLLEMFWGLLPDKCQGDNCGRKGMRGNENIVNGKILCDYCTPSKIMKARVNPE